MPQSRATMDAHRGPRRHRRLPDQIQHAATPQQTGLSQPRALRRTTCPISGAGRATPALRRTIPIHSTNLNQSPRLTHRVARNGESRQEGRPIHSPADSAASVLSARNQPNVLPTEDLKFRWQRHAALFAGEVIGIISKLQVAHGPPLHRSARN